MCCIGSIITKLGYQICYANALYHMAIYEESLYLLWPITFISFNVKLNGQGICNCLCFVEGSVRFYSLPSTRQLKSLKRPSQSFARTAVLTQHERHNFSLKMTSENSWFRLASWGCTLVTIYYSELKFRLAQKPACCLAGGVWSARLSQNCSCRLNMLPLVRMGDQERGDEHKKIQWNSAKRLLCFLGIYPAVSRDLRVEEQTELTLQTVLCQLRKVPDFFLKKACKASIWKGVTAFGTKYLD